MRFRLIDRITQLEPGQHIEAVKHLSADERYLDDHFPKFPIMPGVLMLETMYQAGLWLVRRTEDFAHSVVVLNEARNVKFSGFVQPGQSLVVTADIKKQDGNRTTLVTQGTVDGKVVVSARLVVEAFQLADRYPHRAATHDYLMREVRQQFERVASGTPEDPPSPGLSMRWMWIDRFVEFVRGQRSVAIKNVSLTEEPLSDYLPGFPVLPCSLIVEGLAWTGGILANDQRGIPRTDGTGQGQQGRVPPPGLAGRPTPVFRRARSDRGRGRVHPRDEPRRGRVAGRSRTVPGAPPRAVRRRRRRSD